MSVPSDNPAIAEGLRLLQAGDAPGAVALLEQATAQNPSDGSAFQYLGVARTQTGDYLGGVSALRQAAELLPSVAGVWFNLGIALNRAGRIDDARATLQRSLTLDPNNDKARLALNALPAAAPAPYTPPTYTPYNPSPPTSVAPAPVLGSPGVYTPPGAAAYTPFPGGVNTRMQPPSMGQRIGRGLGWGVVYGQWWTLLNTFWFIVYGGLKDTSAAIVYIVLSVIVFTFMGSLTGLIAAVVDADTNVGSIIGVVAGMLLFAAEYFFIGGSPLSLINVFLLVLYRQICRANGRRENPAACS